MTQQQIRVYYALAKELSFPNDMKFEMALAWSNKRTSSLSELTNTEALAMFQHLQGLVEEAKKLYRGKIIYLLCQVGMVDASGKADFERINHYIKNIGTANPRQVVLAWCYKSELITILKQVEMYHKSFLKKQTV
jgi:hypothetical protein